MSCSTTGRLCLLALCLAVSGGCSGQTNPGPNTAGQVIAQLGNQVVTTLELDNELRLANVAFEKRTDPLVIKQALTEMVLRTYLVQRALDGRLDQEPNVLMDMARTREQVLANAFIARKTANTSITSADIDRYIAQNPAKFADRQVMTVDQIRFALLPEVNAIIDASKTAKSLDEIEQRLTLSQIPHLRSIGRLSQADLPESVADALQARKSQDIFFGRLGSSGLYFKVKDTGPDPLLGTAARTAARQALNAEAAKREIAHLRSAAQLEVKYSGNYASIMHGAAPHSAAVAPAQK